MIVTILSPSIWSTNQVSNHLIARELAEKGKVYYYETPGVIGSFGRALMIVKSLFSLKRKKSEFNRPSSLRIEKISRFPMSGLPFLDYLVLTLGSRKQLKQLNKRLEDSNIVIVCSPIWFVAIDILYRGRLASLYSKMVIHVVDKWSTYAHLRRYLDRFSAEISSIQRVATPNVLLAQDLGKSDACLIPHCFSQALSFEEYTRSASGPQEVRLVFAGTIANWLDIELLEFIASQESSWKITLVGDASLTLKDEYKKRLENIDNLEWLPSMSRSKMHSLLMMFSVGLIPYKQNNQHIAYSSPTKIMDYLGCGLPVVSTSIQYCLEHPFVQVGRSKDEFLRLVIRSLEIEEMERQAYKEYAFENRWEKAAKKIASLTHKV